MGLNTTSGLSFGGGLSLGGGLSRGGGLVQTGSTPTSVVAAYAAAVATNGGAVSAARQAILLTFFTAEFASGAYALTDDYWGLWAEDAPGALTSMKQLRLATATASPTFTANAGYAFNGSTQFINTGFIGTQMAIAARLNNQRVAAYERTNVSAAGTAIGAGTTGTTNTTRLTPRNGNNFIAQMQSSGPTVLLNTADSRALIAASRADDVATIRGYQRGVATATGTGTPGTTTPALPATPFYLGALNNGAAASSFRACSLGFACFGAALSATQELAQYNAVQAMATSIGAQV